MNEVAVRVLEFMRGFAGMGVLVRQGFWNYRHPWRLLAALGMDGGRAPSPRGLRRRFAPDSGARLRSLHLTFSFTLLFRGPPARVRVPQAAAVPAGLAIAAGSTSRSYASPSMSCKAMAAARGVMPRASASRVMRATRS